MAIKIFNQYGEGTEDILKNNPYKLVEDIDGVGFFTADKIAMSLGVPEDSDFRIRASILHVMRENSDKNGNTYMQKIALVEGVFQLINIPNLEERTDSVINKLVLDNYLKKLEIDGEDVFALGQYFKIEKVLADTLLLLNAYENSNYDIDEDIDLYETINKIKMHEHQRDAVK
jgi:exodeoxyribonuclease V alpha subunit